MSEKVLNHENFLTKKKKKCQSHNVSRSISLPHVLGVVHREKPTKALAGVGHLVTSRLHHQLAFTNCYKKRTCGSFNDRQNVICELTFTKTR